MTKLHSIAASKGAPFPTCKLLSMMLTVASSSLPFGAIAQTASDTTDTAPKVAKPSEKAPGTSADVNVKLDQVLVTATRRREPAREVPMQVDILSTEKLQQSGATTLSDYLASEPGIDVKTTGGAGNNAINIRGVSTGDQTISTVSTYVDDVAVGSSSAFANGSASALDMALLDLNHIEVLRGPQGTLYGAGAMGGLLKYVTNEPDTYDFSGQVSLGVSTTKGGAASYTASGILNVPLSEGVAGFRVSAFSEHVGGSVDAIGPAARKNLDSGESKGARVSVLLLPSNQLKVRLTATGQDIRRDGTDFAYYHITTGQPVSGYGTRTLATPDPYSVRVGVAAADIEYDFGWARLNSITSVQTSRIGGLADYSYVYGPLVGLPTVVFDNRYSVHKQTQEFRLTSKAGTEFEWLAGLYYNHETGRNQQTLTGETTGDLLHATLPSKYREEAAYADVTWNLSKKFSLTGGMRIARNVQAFDQTGGGLLLGGGPDITLNGASSETSKTYLGTAKYALTPTSNVYVRIASGYRPGGPNFAIPDAPPTFKHDTLWSYEAGYKADLLDKSLSLQAAVYDIRWSQIQQYTAVGGLSVITNGGKAEIQGMELSATYRPVSALTLTGRLAYNDARLTEDAPGLGADGAPLPNNARFSTSLSANYTFDLASHPAYTGLSQRWVGKRNAGFAGNNGLPQYYLPKYNLTDLQAGIDLQRFQVGVSVRNLFNKRAQLGAETGLAAPDLGGPVQVTEAKPITFGINLTAKF